MKNLLILIALASILALPGSGWSKADLQQKVIFEKKGDHVFLLYESDKDNNVVAQGFEHPVQMTAEKVSMILGRLRYSKSFLFEWTGDYDIFSKPELDRLSGPISRALQNASSNEWVGFASTVLKQGAVDFEPVLTDGYIFKKDGKLHVVLLNLKFKLDKDKKNCPKNGDPRDWFELEAKRINLTDAISAPPVIADTPFLERHHDNWAVIDTEALFNPKKEKPTKIEKGNLVDRMKILKELFDKDLITKEEYKKKKEEMLNGL